MTIADLVKRLETLADEIDRGVSDGCFDGDAAAEAANALAVAERVIAPFARLHDEIARLTEIYDGESADPNNWSKSCQWEDLTAAADWLARHATGQKCPDCNDTGLRDSGGVYPWGEAIFVPCDHNATGQRKGGDDAE